MLEQFTLDRLRADPVLSEYALPLRATFYPLGFPLTLETNSDGVIQAAFEGWNMFSQKFDTAPMRVSLGVRGSGNSPIPSKSVFHSREHLMSFYADADNFAICDFSRSFAFGWVTETVAADHPLLRYRFLTPTANMLAEQLALAPIHCALIARHGRGVALFGDSLAGKSTLAYACARAGWTFVSDDGTFLVRDRLDRFGIGNPHSIRLRDETRQFFPELADRIALAQPNGKMAIEVLTQDLPIATAHGCPIEHVVVLNRDERGTARMRSYPKEEALASCERHVSFGTSSVRAAQKQCYGRLLTAGVWELCYRDLDEAIGCLERLVDSGELA